MSFGFIYNVVSGNHSVQNSSWGCGVEGVYSQLKVYILYTHLSHFTLPPYHLRDSVFNLRGVGLCYFTMGNG